MSLNAPDYNNNPMTKQAYEDGVREGKKQMLEEMLKMYHSKDSFLPNGQPLNPQIGPLQSH